MTPDEIRRNYRQAKDPQNQIQILADLNVCSVAKIKNILGVSEVNTVFWTPEKDAELLAMKESGMNWDEISLKIDTSKRAIEVHYCKLMKKKKQAEAAVTKQAIFTELPSSTPIISTTENTSALSTLSGFITELSELVGFTVGYMKLVGIGNNGDRINLELTRDDAQAAE